MRGSLLVFLVFLSLSLASPGQAQQKDCGTAADGCAKKSGSSAQVKANFQPGDTIENYTIIRDPARYGLSPYGTYYKSGGYVYLVERDSKRVLDLVGVASALQQ